MRAPRLPVAGLAVAAIVAGIAIASPSQAAPCVLYPDKAADTAYVVSGNNVPVTEADVDITGVAVSTAGDALVGYVTVTKLGASGPGTALGDWHEYGFTIGGKKVAIFQERLAPGVVTVYDAAIGRGGVFVDGTLKDATVVAKYDVATNSVSLSLPIADLEKLVAVPVKKAKLTAFTGRTRLNNAAVYLTLDTAAGPETASYTVGTVCTPPVGAAPAPAPATTAPAPSASASASAEPEPSESAEPSASSAPAPKPKPSASTAPKTNPGCGTTAAPAPKPAASASEEASAEPAASASASVTAAPAPARADVAPATPLPGTTVSLQVSSTEITACNSPLLSGRVTDIQGRPVPGAEVKLSSKAYNGKEFAPVATVTTDANGLYKMSVRPLVETRYAAAVGDAESATAPITVHTRVVVESPRRDSAVGSPMAVRGRLVPGHANAPVALGYVRDGRYVLLARAATNAQGYYVLTGRPARGRYTFVVSTPGREGNLAGQDKITLTVQ